MSIKNQKILITGAAGFVGFHLARRCLELGAHTLGTDNLNDYYSVQLKKDRIKTLEHPNFEFVTCDLNDPLFVQSWQKFRPDLVYHLAAQAGVRYSLTHPEKYIHSNLNGFFQVLDCAKKIGTGNLFYASSSSVYGDSTPVPFSVQARADQPISIYAATKRSNELMAYSYHHLFKLPLTGLRFFTVYGSWGRPDMAYFSFTKDIVEEKPITLFNPERQRRDFTHVSDVVESLVRLAESGPAVEHRLLNIGASQPTSLMDFVKTLEQVIGKKAILKTDTAQAGDVSETYADVSELEKIIRYKPIVSLKEGLIEFYSWYQDYFKK